MSDYISRADAIDAVAQEWLSEASAESPYVNDDDIDGYRELAEELFADIPSAEPNCENCKHYEPKYDVCHAPELVKQVTSKLKNPCDSLLKDDSAECKEQKSKLEHDREWIIGCIKHDGFIKTDRFDKANQIILEALSADAVQIGELANQQSKASTWLRLILLDTSTLICSITANR